MRIFEYYFVFFISTIGTILAVEIDEYYQFYTELLDLHNEYRKKHDAKPLVLDDELAEEARKCIDDVSVMTEADKQYGMNTLFPNNNSELNARDVFFSWYNTGATYDYDNDTEMQKHSNPFTQIVWKKTSRMGVAVVEGETIYTVVATYKSRGNQFGHYYKNVKPPQ